jgi:hypothetical protein
VPVDKSIDRRLIPRKRERESIIIPSISRPREVLGEDRDECRARALMAYISYIDLPRCVQFLA